MELHTTSKLCKYEPLPPVSAGTARPTGPLGFLFHTLLVAFKLHPFSTGSVKRTPEGYKCQQRHKTCEHSHSWKHTKTTQL